MMGRPAPELPATVRTAVTWKGAGDLRQRVAAARQKVAASHERLVDGVLAAGLCRQEDRALFAAQVDIQIKDQRSHSSEPLPVLR